MEDKITCKKCESDNIKFIAEPVEIERTANFLFVLICALLTIVIAVGYYMILKAAFNMSDTSNYIRTSESLEQALTAYINHQIQVQENQNSILTGAMIMFAGFIPLILLVIWRSIATRYEIKTKTKAICMNCGRKWDFKAEKEKEELKKAKEQSE